VSKTVRNVIISVAIVVVLSVLLGLLRLPDVPIFLTLMPVFVGALIFFLLQMLSGNKVEIQATPAERQAALAVAPAAGTALIYIYRDGFVGKALGIDVVIDGQPIAQLKSPRFVALTLDAGAHLINAGPKGFAASQNKSGETAFNAVSGETIVFHLGVSMGAIKNSVVIRREPLPELALKKLSKITMVAPARQTPAPPPTL
jgi:hypothetical protein